MGIRGGIRQCRRKAKQNYTFVSGKAGDEKKTHPGGRKNFFFVLKCRKKFLSDSDASIFKFAQDV